MKTIYMMMPVIILIGCMSTKNNSAVLQDSSKQPGVKKDTSEYLDWGTLLLNGKYPLVTTLKKLESIGGKADSISRYGVECISGYHSVNPRIAHYGLTKFENFKDSVELDNIDFTKNHTFFLQNKTVRLDHNSTFADLKKIFPKSFEDSEKLNVFGIPGLVDSVTLPTSADQKSDGHWILMFQDGKLIRIDHWFPC